MESVIISSYVIDDATPEDVMPFIHALDTILRTVTDEKKRTKALVLSRAMCSLTSGLRFVHLRELRKLRRSTGMIGLQMCQLLFLRVVGHAFRSIDRGVLRAMMAFERRRTLFLRVVVHEVRIVRRWRRKTKELEVLRVALASLRLH